MMKFREVRGTPMSRGTEPPLVPPPQVIHHPNDNVHCPCQYRIHVGMPIWLCIHNQLVDVSWTQRQEDVIGEKHLSTGSNQHPHWSHLIMINNRWVRPKRVSAANERGRLGYGEGARLKVKLMLLFVPLLKIFFISSSNSLCSKYQT